MGKWQTERKAENGLGRGDCNVKDLRFSSPVGSHCLQTSQSVCPFTWKVWEAKPPLRKVQRGGTSREQDRGKPLIHQGLLLPSGHSTANIFSRSNHILMVRGIEMVGVGKNGKTERVSTTFI